MTDDYIRIQMNAVVDKNDGTSGALDSAIQSRTTLPPIGVFWDIENCQVPKNKSAFDVVQRIRETYFEGHREAEFMCVCDVNKESKRIINELNNAQVVVVHIDAMCKNAADIKLRQCMQKFADIQGSPATVILISGDVNFAPDLSELRYRRHFTIIVIHNGEASNALLAFAHSEISLSRLSSTIKNRPVINPQNHKQHCKLIVSNLPTNHDFKHISQRLERLSENCGGKVESIKGSQAVMRFASLDCTKRARKRMDHEDVYGNQISVNFPSTVEPSRKKCATPTKDKKNFQTAHQPSRPHSNPLPNRPLDPSYVGEKSVSQTNDKNSSDEVVRPKTMFNPLSLRFGDSSNPGSEMDSCNGHTAYGWNANGKRNEPINAHLWGNQATSKTNSFSVKDKISTSSRQIRGSANADTISVKSETSASQKEATSFNRSWMSGSSGSRRNTPSPHLEFIGQVATVSTNCDGSNALLGDAEPVELQIANLDPNVDVKHLKQHLVSIFREHVKVLHVYATVNTDGNISAGVKVPSMNEAQYAISKLHRTRLGSKRISISIASNVDSIPITVLRSC